MTDPVNEIIPRQPKDENLRNLLIELSKGIEEIVNFGSNILKWDLETAKGSDELLPPILLFRNFLELIDSISILIQKSSIDPCKIILRGVLETYFSLEYIFEKDTYDRSMAFMVWHAHKNLKWYKKLDIDTPDGKQFQEQINKDKSFIKMDLPKFPGLSIAIENVESLLKRTEYQKAENEYQRLMNEREKNPNWYRLFNGPKSIQELATQLNLTGLYDGLYRLWSGPAHGTEILQGKLRGNKDNIASIVQIRYPKDAKTVALFVYTLSLKAFRIYFQKRLPNKEKELNDWTISSMREFYSKLIK